MYIIKYIVLHLNIHVQYVGVYIFCGQHVLYGLVLVLSVADEYWLMEIYYNISHRRDG